MKQQILIHEAETQDEISRFWRELHEYHRRDILPEEKDRESLEYFLSAEYQSAIEALRTRANDRAQFLFFCRDGAEVGFALTAHYPSEDGKCFILEFGVYPAFRGGGTGSACAQELLHWMRSRGAAYFELNCGGDERRPRFWSRLGFRENGADEWGEPLMLLPPEENIPVTVVRAQEAGWQLFKLQNGYLREIGEAPQDEAAQQRLTDAVHAGRIIFFLAMRGTRAVGMCSVTAQFSTFACADVGTFEDFYVEPVFRRQKIARKLVQAAQAYARERGLSSLSVCCADCDIPMYRALGFTERLGTTMTAL